MLALASKSSLYFQMKYRELVLKILLSAISTNALDFCIKWHSSTSYTTIGVWVAQCPCNPSWPSHALAIVTMSDNTKQRAMLLVAHFDSEEHKTNVSWSCIDRALTMSLSNTNCNLFLHPPMLKDPYTLNQWYRFANQHDGVEYNQWFAPPPSDQGQWFVHWNISFFMPLWLHQRIH